jgi:hypothetical protein
LTSALGAGSLCAQAPRPGIDQPAPTTWQQYTPPAPKPAPVPTITVPDLPSLPTIVPPKVVTFQKPANDAQPVELPVVKPRDVTLPTPPAMTVPTPKPVQAMPVPVAVPPQPVPAVLVKPQPPKPQPQPAPVQPPMPTQPPTVLSDPSSYRSSLGGLPTQGQLFRLDNDAALDARIIKDLTKPDGVRPTEKFPVAGALTVPADKKYEPKTVGYSPVQLLREPSYVIHRHLYFEEMNAERAGWDAGPAQAFISSAYFYRDVALLPARFASHCRDNYDCSAGKCMPGSPTPYYCYPLGITVFGGVVDATVITGLAFIIP